MQKYFKTSEENVRIAAKTLPVRFKFKRAIQTSGEPTSHFLFMTFPSNVKCLFLYFSSFLWFNVRAICFSFLSIQIIYMPHYLIQLQKCIRRTFFKFFDKGIQNQIRFFNNAQFFCPSKRVLLNHIPLYNCLVGSFSDNGK